MTDGALVTELKLCKVSAHDAHDAHDAGYNDGIGAAIGVIRRHEAAGLLVTSVAGLLERIKFLEAEVAAMRGGRCRALSFDDVIGLPKVKGYYGD